MCVLGSFLAECLDVRIEWLFQARDAPATAKALSAAASGRATDRTCCANATLDSPEPRAKREVVAPLSHALVFFSWCFCRTHLLHVVI